ncbi:CDP-alcohol phosphatidyltransferase family protein [Novosphingobium album (ex Hu et al. 2023)]|uniref:CDP-alcohol phosphatidyltransferase family protein n=1 Tax=Novosphingobium album (ex Hu et al. 2023) TaxID=2930093 RepID=A0ABT0B6W6_9SPHN|nr:CDP-alcohol phosphatidyltransferase family protein [Novosphingobium album (ex Hu et al. 2023)]MCJ2180603.1 CDP-alcohol phosphatidyltransferase family protein [Novosphingobium album (ex Hu et al. 2023)]
MLTSLGVAGAAVSLCGYWASASDAGWLWVAIGGLAINWLGDSLDGSLARHRNAERPRYGFFIDHMTDTLAMALIAIGIGLSPYADLTCAMAVLLAYYVLVIFSMANCIATGVFRITFNGVGPTEIRLVIMACTASAALMPIPRYQVGIYMLTVFDLIMLVFAAVMMVMCAQQAIKTARALAVEEPPLP